MNLINSIVCKKKGTDSYYSQLEPGRTYELILIGLSPWVSPEESSYHTISMGCDNPLCKGGCNKSLFLKEYFYTKE